MFIVTQERVGRALVGDIICWYSCFPKQGNGIIDQHTRSNNGENFLRNATSLLELSQTLVRGGPKNYACKVVNSTTNKTKTVCKVRGITLNYTASQLVNFDVIKDMILKGDETESYSAHGEKN